MVGHPIAPQAQRPQQHFQASNMMHSYSNSPLARSTTDLSDVTHEFEPDVDADGFRHPGNHHAVLPGDYSPGSSLQPRAKPGRPPSRNARPFKTRPHIVEEPKRDSFTFEHEPDVDADGERHHHENLSSPALRALQDVVVPLDPRAGRIVITPAPTTKPNFSPYRHHADLPNRSIEDFQDPEELHSHAAMIYGIDEARASQYSVPDWQEGEAAAFIEEASHGELHPPTVPKRPVATKLPIEPTGQMIAPLGNIAGDRQPVGPTRNMNESDYEGIDGAYTKDGEGSAGLPFDANSGQSRKEGEIEVSDDASVAPLDMNASIETIRPTHRPSIASLLEEPEKKPVAKPGPVEDVKLPGHEGSLSQDGSAMDVDADKDERPEWLRAAEMMANNEYDKLTKEHLVVNERASSDTLDYASAARATKARDNKIDRGTSYPSLAEMDEAGQPREQDHYDGERQGVSHLPEKDLGGANPPTGTSQRQEKFAVEDETVNLKSDDAVEPATAAKFLGLSAGAAAGASLPAAALMTSSRDTKSNTAGETNITEPTPPLIHNRPELDTDKETPAIPQHRPSPKDSVSTDSTAGNRSAEGPVSGIPPRPQKTSGDDAGASPSIPARPAAEKSLPVVPRRPASSASSKESPQVPSRPAKTNSMPKEGDSKPQPLARPNVPARPVPGKLAGSSKFAFASALEAKLKVGPALPKKKEVEVDQAMPEESVKPLVDARKGRAKGPQKRKPPTSASVPEGSPSESVDAGKFSTGFASPVCEKGELFVSRFGVEMRSMSVQTGVIKISSPAGSMTVLEGAGTDYVGQTVVVDSPAARSRAIPEFAQSAERTPVSDTVEPASTVEQNNTTTEATDEEQGHEITQPSREQTLESNHHETPTALSANVSLKKQDSEELTAAKRDAMQSETEVEVMQDL